MANPHVNKANKYARDVVSGKIDACKWVLLACQRHIADLTRSKKASFQYVFSPASGEKICKFASMMVHTKGKWAKNRENIKLEPWQCFCLAVIFGWVHKKTGLRRFREAYMEIPRKNGKSVIGAVIGNYMFTADGEEGSEVYSGATTEKQAWEVFRPAKLMIEKNPPYKNHFGIQANAKNLYHPKTSSRFEPIIGKPGDGASPHCCIVDEYHEHPTPELYDTMITGMGAREQPLQAVITTAGSNLAGPCYDKRSQILKILDGTFENDEVFGIIYTIEDDDDWTDIKTWKKANPNFGVSVFEDFLLARLKEASQRASRQNIIRCKHLNQWMNTDTAWMNMLEWNKCSDSTLSIDDFMGEPCFASIDLSSKVDIAAKVKLFKRTINGEIHYYSFGTYYLPQDTVDREENTHYQTWALEERLTVTPGAVIDYAYIEDDMREMASDFEIVEVPYDPFQATQLSTRMDAEGFPMVEMRPTVLNFSEPMKELEAAVLSRRFHFGDDSVLTWMASNVIGHYDKKDNIYPNKERPQNKIDGIVALIMGIGRAMVRDDIENPYDERGLIVL